MSAESDLRTAMGHHQAGRLDRAEDFYRKILRRQPDHPDALHLFGVLEFGRGRPREAIRLIGLAVRSLPKFAPAWANLGNAQNAAGDAASAEASYRRAIELDPALAEGHVNLAMLLNDRGDFPAAEEACRAALRARPGLLEGHITLAGALRGQRRLTEAEQEYRKALGLRPDRVETLSDLATLLGEMGRYNEALERHHQALSAQPDRGLLHAGLGSTQALMGDLAGAEQSFARQLAVAPLDLPVWLARGGALSGLGRFEEARECFQHVLRADPDRAEAYWRLSLIGALPAAGDTEARLAGVLDRDAAAPLPRAFAGFALARLREDAGRHEAAFAAATAANRLFVDLRARNGQRFDPDGFDADIDRIIAATPRAVFADVAAWGDPSELPVFLVGMPRSGITLAEQILASHPAVHAAGPISRIAPINAALTEANRERGRLADWDAALCRSSAEAHVAGLASLGAGKSRVVDSTPDNVLQLGLIAALFPNARVVLCERDARDICVSNYFQLFVDGHLFGRDLEHCARRLRGVSRLMAHWREVLPLRIHTLSYEALVGAPEAEMRRLLDFLGLDWDAACLAFQRTGRAVITPAMWRVRQPLDASGVGRWRPYAAHLPASLTQG